MKDEKLLASGPKLSVSRDWIRRDGKVLPVIGTTYMASDVHRKFLFEPDPPLLGPRFAPMLGAGINMVRTGLWTGWSRVMLDPGEWTKGAVRDRRLPAERRGTTSLVCFNFFAFIPPASAARTPTSIRADRRPARLRSRVHGRYRGMAE